MSKKDKQTSTTGSSTAPPEFILAELQKAMGMSSDILEGGNKREFYDGSTVVPFSSDTVASMDSLRGLLGSGESRAASGGFDVLNGILNSDATDPAALEAASKSGIDKVMAQTNGVFGRAGRSGSGLAARAAGEGIGSVVADQQQRIRENQLQGLSYIPGYDKMQTDAKFMDSKILAGLGQAQEGKQQEQVLEDVAKWNFEQDNDEQSMLNDYIARIQGLAPMAGGSSTGTSTQTTKQSPWGALMGLGMSMLAPGSGAGGSFLSSLMKQG